MKKKPQHRDMQFRVEYDKRPPIRAMVWEDEAAMREHLDIYRNPNTRFHVTHVMLEGGRPKTGAK